MIVYKKDSKGKVRFYEVTSYKNTLELTWGIVGGEPIMRDILVEPKAGRTLREQINLEMNSLIKKKKDSGYRDTIEEAEKHYGENALELPKPMLAKPLKDVSSIDWSQAYLQFKYDGHRCIIGKTDQGMIAYSRNGQVITSIPHILEQVDSVLDVGEFLDGELYNHSLSLQQISSQVRKKSIISDDIYFMCFDAITDDPFRKRFFNAQVRCERILHSSNLVKFAHTTQVTSEESIATRSVMTAKKLGYEGLIIRQNSLGYQSGKRPNQLVKIKTMLDGWFEIVNTSASKDNWAIFTLTHNGKEFNVSAPGDIKEKRKYLQRNVIGKKARVEYANLTAYGIPFHPICTDIEE